MDTNIKKNCSLVLFNRELNISVVSEIEEIDKQCVRQILHNMQKVYAKMVAKIFTFEQQEA